MELKNNGKINFVIGLFLRLDEAMSGGQIAKHKLSYKLAEKGHNVYIFCEPEYKHENIIRIPSNINILQGHLTSYSYEPFSYLQNNTVSILDEVGGEVSFGTKNKVRWITYHTTKNQEKQFSDDEYIFNFGNFKTHTKRNDGKLTVIDYNLDKFFVENNDRKGYCHILSKQTPNNHKEILETFNSTDITRFHNKYDLNQLRIEFNKYEYFLTFDDKTFLTTAAALCGCKVIILNTEDKNLTPIEYKLKNPLNMFGVAYGINDLKWVENTSHLVRDYILELEKMDDKTVDDFIEFWENKCYN